MKDLCIKPGLARLGQLHYSLTVGYMKSTIGYGEVKLDDDGMFMGFDSSASPHKINMSPWLHTIPEELQTMAKLICLEVFNIVVKSPATADTIDEVIEMIRKSLYNKLFEEDPLNGKVTYRRSFKFIK